MQDLEQGKDLPEFEGDGAAPHGLLEKGYAQGLRGGDDEISAALGVYVAKSTWVVELRSSEMKPS